MFRVGELAETDAVNGNSFGNSADAVDMAKRQASQLCDSTSSLFLFGVESFPLYVCLFTFSEAFCSFNAKKFRLLSLFRNCASKIFDMLQPASSLAKFVFAFI